MYKILVFTLFFYSCGHPHYKNPHVLIKTVRGDIELELFADQAPKTVAAFLSYVDSGYYNKTSFYRVLKDENLPAGNNFGVIQGGLWQTNPNKLITIAGIEHETTRQTGLSHLSGTVSLARAAPVQPIPNSLSVSATKPNSILEKTEQPTGRAFLLSVKYSTV
ncbi:MAG: peptidylprolyl isomerase [Chitinophagaceae bacterium]|nr:peptidylprolyl isomerase [Chitinophagaceae bacterium]